MRHPICRILRRPSAVLVAAMLALVWASAAVADSDRGQPSDRLAFMDSRHAPAAQEALNARAAKLTADAPAATAALKDSLGVEGFVKLDPLTATASFVGKTNGFLTGPSAAPAGGRAGLRQGQRRGARVDGQRRRGARAEARLRRHPRHSPPELRAEGERGHGLRQRRQGQRRQGRTHHQRDRLARRRHSRAHPAHTGNHRGTGCPRRAQNVGFDTAPAPPTTTTAT